VACGKHVRFALPASEPVPPQWHDITPLARSAAAASRAAAAGLGGPDCVYFGMPGVAQAFLDRGLRVTRCSGGRPHVQLATGDGDTYLLERVLAAARALAEPRSRACADDPGPTRKVGLPPEVQWPVRHDAAHCCDHAECIWVDHLCFQPCAPNRARGGASRGSPSEAPTGEGPESQPQPQPAPKRPRRGAATSSAAAPPPSESPSVVPPWTGTGTQGAVGAPGWEDSQWADSATPWP